MSVLSSYYSYRPLAGVRWEPTDDEPPISRATLEQVQAKLQQADTAFTQQKYHDALKLYLDIYAWTYQLLHQGFPVEAVAGNPHLVDKVNIMDALLKVSAELLKQPHTQAASAVPLAVEKVPAAVWQLVESHSLAPAEQRRTDKFAYASAVASLASGEWHKALQKLQIASQLNQGRDTVLEAHITAARGAAQVLSGNQSEALATLGTARQLYIRLGMQSARATVDNNLGVSYTLAGNTEQAAAAFDNAQELQPAADEHMVVKQQNGMQTVAIVPIQQTDDRPSIDITLAVFDGTAQWITLPPTIDQFPRRSLTVRVPIGDAVQELDLAQDGAGQLVANFYQPRVTATTLAALNPNYKESNVFRAALSHLYSFVLPLNIGDCYVALGRRLEGVTFYLKVLQYKYLNQNIELFAVWLKAAKATVEEADEQYKQGAKDSAKKLYEQVLLSGDSVPTASPLYSGEHFSKVIPSVTTTLESIQKNQFPAVNAEIALLIAHVKAQLAKLVGGLNWLGLPEEAIPIWSFDFLQQTARYYAQHAIQAYREYITFHAAADQAEMTGLQLSQAVVMAQNALNVQQAQQNLALQQINVANRVLQSATVHRNNLVAARDQFNQVNWVLGDLDRFQMWAANAGQQGGIVEVHYDWGSGYRLDIGETTIQSHIDQIALYRNQLTHQLQIDNYNRQITEANQQIAVAQAQAAVASAQVQVAATQTWSAMQQVLFAKQTLSHFQSNAITPDLWHSLAHRLRSIAKDYLHKGIYIAFLMEQAYNVENDQDIKRIRMSYTDPQTSNLTAADLLLQDIDSFTVDLLSSTKGRRNFVRHVISLADFTPRGFTQFRQTGQLEFTLPMHVFDQAYPGSYLHRLQNIEIEVEGLQVPEGLTGKLTHLGISSWRRENGAMRQRVTPPETMLISGFRLRRDLSLYRAEPGRQNLFENSGVAGSWLLEIPASANDIDFTTISDVRLVMYFHCQHSPSLETALRATFPLSSEASQAFSARLHAPDQFFAFGPPPNGTNRITFDLQPQIFPYNQRKLVATQIGVQVLRQSASGRAEPFPGVPLTVKMAGQSANGTTSAQGTVASGLGDTSLAALLNKPVSPVEVVFSGPARQRTQIADVFLIINYTFDYR